MNLREAILKKLAGSSGQNSILLDELRKIAEPICDDLGALYKLLDELYLDKTIHRTSGYKNSKPFVAYWIAGAVQIPAVPFQTSTPASPPQAHLVRNVATPKQAFEKLQPVAAKVQEKAAIPPSPITQEKPMGHPANDLRTTIQNKIHQQPGVKQTEVIEFTLAKHPESTEKQIRKTIENMVHNSKSIKFEGIRAERTLRPVTDVRKPANKPAVAAVVKKNIKLTPPRRLSVPATFDPEFNFAFGVRKDGGVSIFKGGATISLSSSEVKTIIDHATL